MPRLVPRLRAQRAPSGVGVIPQMAPPRPPAATTPSSSEALSAAPLLKPARIPFVRLTRSGRRDRLTFEDPVSSAAATEDVILTKDQTGHAKTVVARRAQPRRTPTPPKTRAPRPLSERPYPRPPRHLSATCSTCSADTPAAHSIGSSDAPGTHYACFAASKSLFYAARQATNGPYLPYAARGGP